MKRFTLPTLLVAALPWRPALAEVAAYDAPLLPPPSVLQVIAHSAPTGGLEFVGADPGMPPPLDETMNDVAPPVRSAEYTVLPTLPPDLVAAEAACVSCVCESWQAYPSCGDRALCPRFWFAAAEATFLGVNAESGGQSRVTYDDSNLAGTELATVGGAGHEGFTVAPRVTLGYQFGPAWGFAGRFWRLSDASASALPAAAANLDAFATDEQTATELTSADLEAIRSFTPGRWKLDAAAGVRHAALGTSTRLSVAADYAGSNETTALLAGDTRFDGTGPTTALTARRGLGSSSASLFLAGRSSMLWGSGASRARAVVLQETPSGLVPALLEIRRQADEPFAWIGEVQLGVQWDVPLQTIPVNAFFRAAAEYQRWAVDADVNATTTLVVTTDSISSTSVAAAGNGRVDLYGFALATGFSW